MTLFFHDGQCLLKPYFVKCKLAKISENGKKGKPKENLRGVRGEIIHGNAGKKHRTGS